MMSNDEERIFKEWPVLNESELISFYNEIKLNKKLTLNWKNPGRIEPEKFSLLKKEETNEQLNNTSKNDENLKKKTENDLNKTSVNSKFDIFEEFMDEDDNKDTKDDLFKPGGTSLMSSKIQRPNTEKKIANIDKIFDDMRKTYENEQQQQQQKTEQPEEETLAVSSTAANNPSQEEKIETQIDADVTPKETEITEKPIEEATINDQFNTQETTKNETTISAEEAITKPATPPVSKIETESIEINNNSNENLTDVIKSDNNVNDKDKDPFDFDDEPTTTTDMTSADDSNKTSNIITTNTSDVNDANDEKKEQQKQQQQQQQQQQLNIKSNESLMDVVKEDEEELINYRKNHFNLTSSEDETTSNVNVNALINDK